MSSRTTTYLKNIPISNPAQEQASAIAMARKTRAPVVGEEKAAMPSLCPTPRPLLLPGVEGNPA
jgi:hypothetical protein